MIQNLRLFFSRKQLWNKLMTTRKGEGCQMTLKTWMLHPSPAVYIRAPQWRHWIYQKPWVDWFTTGKRYFLLHKCGDINGIYAALKLLKERGLPLASLWNALKRSKTMRMRHYFALANVHCNGNNNLVLSPSFKVNKWLSINFCNSYQTKLDDVNVCMEETRNVDVIRCPVHCNVCEFEFTWTCNSAQRFI